MFDIEYQQNDAVRYECFRCGHIMIAETHPGTCPKCDGPTRNQTVPLE